MAREVLGVVGGAVGGYFFGPTGAQIGFAIGSTIGGIVDPPHIDGPKLGDASLQTSRDGVPIPIGWGITHVVGNIIQINPMVETTKKVSSGKGGTTTTETTRTRTFAIGIARSIDGPIGGLIRVWENNKLVYDGRTGTTFSALDNAAFLNSVTIYLGTEDQLPDPELETDSGVGNTPAYRALAYIVFNNKDITLFGSSIPSYRFEIWAGREYDAGGGVGYSYTQYDYFGSDPNFRHPFRYQIYEEFTMSVVFSPVTLPFSTENTDLFVLMFQGEPTKLFYRRRSIGGSFYIGFNMGTYDGGSVNSELVANGVHEITFDYPLWSYTDWYWIAVSYDSVSGNYKYAIRNLTRGEEGTVISGTASNPVPIEFDDMNSQASVCAWGSSVSNDSVTTGAMSQLVIHDKYLDLTSLVNRNKFCCLTGVIDIGDNGENIFDEIPLVHSPRGFPQEANGTVFIGDTDDLYASSEYDRDGHVPPVCGE